MTITEKLQLQKELDRRNEARTAPFMRGGKTPEQIRCEKQIRYYLERALDVAKQYDPEIRRLEMKVAFANSTAPTFSICNEYESHDAAHPLHYSSLND